MAPEPDVRGRVVLGFPQVFCEISVGSILYKITWKKSLQGIVGKMFTGSLHEISARDLLTRACAGFLNRIVSAVS